MVKDSLWEARVGMHIYISMCLCINCSEFYKKVSVWAGGGGYTHKTVLKEQIHMSMCLHV